MHMIRFHGVLAPNAKLRSKVIPKPKRLSNADPALNDSLTSRKKKMSWAMLLKRTFNVDVLKCSLCQNDAKIIAAIQNKNAIIKILKHLNLPHEPPEPHPARAPPQTRFHFAS